MKKILIPAAALALIAAVAAAPVLADGYVPQGQNTYEAQSQGSTVYAANILEATVSSTDGFGNLRTKASMDGQIITPIYNGAELKVTAVTYNSKDNFPWGYTTYDGQTGWIGLPTLQIDSIQNAASAEYDVTVTNASNISLRKGPGTEYDQLAKPSSGQTLRITQTTVNNFDGRVWGRTTYNGKTGWVSLSWTQRASGSGSQASDIIYYTNIMTAVVSSSNGAVMRNAPGSASPAIQSVPSGTSVTVSAVTLSSTDNTVWGITTYNGQSGWIAVSQTEVTGIQNACSTSYKVTVSDSANCKLRMGPGTEYALLAESLATGTSLTVSQTVINSFDGRPWGLTSVNGQTGWISLSWTDRVSGS